MRHNESTASGQVPGGGTWQTGAKVLAQARPSQWDSIRLTAMFVMAIFVAMANCSVLLCLNCSLTYCGQFWSDLFTNQRRKLRP